MLFFKSSKHRESLNYQVLFGQNPIETAIFFAFIQKHRNIFFGKNLTVGSLYYTYLRTCGKKFMKFDYTIWKILAFKVGKKNLSEHLIILNDFDYHYGL